MGERRGPREGSIRERANGTYKGRVTIAGRRISVYGATKTERRRLSSEKSLTALSVAKSVQTAA